MIIYIEGTNQDEDDKRNREGKEVTHSFYKKEKYILVLYLCRVYGEATVTAAAVEREEEESVVFILVRQMIQKEVV